MSLYKIHLKGVSIIETLTPLGGDRFRMDATGGAFLLREGITIEPIESVAEAMDSLTVYDIEYGDVVRWILQKG